MKKVVNVLKKVMANAFIVLAVIDIIKYATERLDKINDDKKDE